MFDALKQDMAQYYDRLGFTHENLTKDPACRKTVIEPVRQKIYQEMDDFYKKNPNLPAMLLKSRLHTVIARHFEPKLFPDMPFFFEMGLRERNSWGMGSVAPSRWMEDRLGKKVHQEHPILGMLERCFAPIYNRSAETGTGLCSIASSFDIDHHTLGYTALFELGINGFLERIESYREDCGEDSGQADFYTAAEESCHALLTVAEKFRHCAEEMLPFAETEQQREYLTMILNTAGRIPALPPETFYEGLAMLLFTREAVATLEYMGISQLGHVDRLLGPLYERDLQLGRITEEQARELIGLWMLYTDVKFDLANNPWPETSTCIQLGGCDEQGRPVYNPVTRMVIQEHHRLGLVNPKLNCRYSADSPAEYLHTIGQAVLAGHNNFVLINDRVVIDGLVKNGVALTDARRYVSGGCQETMLEGLGHTEGAALYVSVPRILDLFLRPGNTDIIPSIRKAESFEDFYEQFLKAAKDFLGMMTDQRNVRQLYNKQWQAYPLFSVTQEGCLETGMDYIRGGARYNFSTVALVGLGTVVDSLYAIREMVFTQKRLCLSQLNQVLSENWQSSEALRNEIIALPKYGHGDVRVDALADSVLRDLADFVRDRENERGGRYIPSLFVYYYFEYFSHCLRATPDGRRNGDLISPGCGPGQLQTADAITEPLNTMHNMDFSVCGGGSAVLDVKLPVSSHLNTELFAAFARSCQALGCPTLQPNVISPEALTDAKVHPEKHRDLIVRVSGLSAYFVALPEKIQDEIIKRNQYNL